MKPGPLLVALIGLAACAHPPQRLEGEFPPITPLDVQRDASVGQRVRWGGVIVETTPRAGETCLQVVSLPLDRRARPRPTDETFGRFLACAPAFYDPEVYAKQREVTVVGAVERLERGKVGDQEYDYPRVAAEVIHLWPGRMRYGAPADDVGMYGYPYVYPNVAFPYGYYVGYPYYGYPFYPFWYGYPYWGWGGGWGWYGGHGGWGGHRGGGGHGGGGGGGHHHR